jgi:nucleoside-diphosphate-sugar epimerase
MKNILATDLDDILQQVKPILGELKDQSVFVTGGTGFIGTWLLETFVWANDTLALNMQITVLTRDPERFASKAAHLYHHPLINYLRGDITDFEFPEGEFPLVVHAATAADAKLNQENPQLMLETILHGTQRILKFAQAAKTKKLLFISSGAVYGKQPANLTHVTEDFSGSPNILDRHAAYGIGKSVAEHLCVLHAAKHDISISIARCFAFVGPYLPLDKHFAVGNFIRDGLLNQDIQILGDGTTYRSYQYAADLVVWLLYIWTQGKSCVPYNVGSDKAVTIAELAAAVSTQFEKVPGVHIAKAANKNILPERYVPCVQRAKDEFGLKSHTTLPEAIAKTIAWHQSSSRESST